jgi:hypothetical protein
VRKRTEVVKHALPFLRQTFSVDHHAHASATLHRPRDVLHQTLEPGDFQTGAGNNEEVGRGVGIGKVGIEEIRCSGCEGEGVRGGIVVQDECGAEEGEGGSGCLSF